MKLNIGCGRVVIDGYINADVIISEGVKFADLNYTLPFPSDTFEEIICHSVLEHIENYNNAITELKRISKNGCIWDIRVPFPFSYGNDNEFHRRRFRYNSFNEGKDDSEQLEIYKGLRVIQRKLKFYPYFFPMEWFARLFPKLYNNSFLRVIFPAHHIYFKIRVVK